MLSGLIVTVIAALASFATTSFVRSNAARLGVVQAPSHRSSHVAPSPSGGGVGIVVGGTLTAVFGVVAAPGPSSFVSALAVPIAVLGFYDDRKPIPARFRFTAQLALVALALCLVIPFDELTARTGLSLPVLVVGLLTIIAAVYWINLFNFMDGIDGIAGSQAIFMLVAAAVLAAFHTPQIAAQGVFWMLIGVAAATGGFLILNWPPAKIFMGDAGSTYLGFMIAMLALLTIVAGWLTLAQWAILAACFVSDATVTLIRRLLLRERVFEAHRRHAYQKLSRRWRGHRPVTLTFIGINLIWLLPLAFLAGMLDCAFAAVWLAYLPLVAATLYAGAGAPDRDY